MMKKFWLILIGLLGLLGACQVETAAPPVLVTRIVTLTPTPIPPTATPALPTPIPLASRSPEEVMARLGADLGGVGDRALEFVDVAKTLRRWETLDADTCPEGDDVCRYAPLDEAGWPTTDARTVFFDFRPYGAWWSADQSQCPQCQDGDFMIDLSGAYKLSFTGEATLQSAEGMLDVRSQMYDRTTNTTTADVVVKPGQGLLFVKFVNTRRTPDSAPNTGIADVRLLRPGYDLSTTDTFTPWILEAVQPFSTLRFMNWVGGNNINPPFESENATLEWSERTLPAMRQNQGEGVAWEYVIELANLTGKNVWINIPIHASDDYVTGLAQLLKDTLHADTLIYIESSNEVWNGIFTQNEYNQKAAEAEVAAGNSTLNNDGTLLTGLWGQRRHIRRLMEISNIFRGVFGDDAINTRIRVIHSWWALATDAYELQLEWLNATYGPPNQYLYAVAAAGYFNVEGISDDATSDEVFKRLRTSSENNVSGRLALQAVADRYGLKHALYEAGPDTAGPLQWDRDTRLLLTLIDAHRDPRMKELVLYDIWNHWLANPDLDADMYIYFTLQSAYSRWGMWGLTEDIMALQTPKFQAITDLVGLTQSPPPAPSFVKAAQLDDGRVVVTWSPAFRAESYTVKRSDSDGGHYRTMAAGLTETVYADPDVQPGQTAYYVVAAVNAQGESGNSVQAIEKLP